MHVLTPEREGHGGHAAMEDLAISPPADTTPTVEIETVDLALPVEARPHPRFEEPLHVTVRQATLLTRAPWTRSLGKLAIEVGTHGWRFPSPSDFPPPKPRLSQADREPTPTPEPQPAPPG